MSFTYKGVLITLSNYLEVFKDLEVDIQDEIRSAILDDTPIADYIGVCERDSYKLGQFRMALREYVPKMFLQTKLSGRCMYLIRYCCRNNIDLMPMKRYVVPRICIPVKTFERLLELLISGVDIRRVDFRIVQDDVVPIICEGLIKGYPMWQCVNGDKVLSASYIRQLMKGMRLNVDISPFLTGDWSEEQLVYLLSNANEVDLSEVVSYINPHFSVDHLEEVIALAELGYDYSLICIQDEEGFPLFNEYQMSVIGKAIRDDVLCDEIYNPEVSDMDMEDIYESLVKDRCKG